MFAIALAYAGTGNNQAVRKLLHFAVSDVNDDVRRAAVTALGFVLFRNHTQVPRVVQLLAESYNPHVRHGATLALGISCASTGLEVRLSAIPVMSFPLITVCHRAAGSDDSRPCGLCPPRSIHLTRPYSSSATRHSPQSTLHSRIVCQGRRR